MEARKIMDPDPKHNWNQASTASQQLLVASQHLAAAVALVENMWRFNSGADTLKAEEANADRIILGSEDIIRAMREIALRFDRNAIQSEPDIEFPNWLESGRR